MRRMELALAAVAPLRVVASTGPTAAAGAGGDDDANNDETENKRRKYKSWGMYALIAILLCAVAVLLGVMLSGMATTTMTTAITATRRSIQFARRRRYLHWRNDRADIGTHHEKKSPAYTHLSTNGSIHGGILTRLHVRHINLSKQHCSKS